MDKYKLLIFINLIVRLPLLFLIPIALFGDGIFRFIPYSLGLMTGNLNFEEPPLYFLLQGFWSLIFSGGLLEFFWKLTPFIFFILVLVILPSVYRVLKINEKEKIILTFLLIFSTWSILLGSSITMEMMVLFFTLSLFIFIEKKNIKNLDYFMIVILSALLFYTKQTSYFIIAGFFIYVLLYKDKKKNEKIKLLACFFLGFLLFIPWLIKNKLLDIKPINPLDTMIFKPFIEFFNPEKIFTYILQGIYENYHDFWFIPKISQVGFEGIIGLMFLAYYLIFIIVTLFISLSIILGLFKYGKENKKYLLLILPVVLFTFLWTFLCRWYGGNAFRYTIAINIFLFLFSAKYINNLNNKNIKKFFYLILILFAMLSVITAYFTVFKMNDKIKQLEEIKVIIEKDNKNYIANDGFSDHYLRYYIKNKKPLNPIDFPKDFKKENEKKIYSTKDYELYNKEDIYYLFKK